MTESELAAMRALLDEHTAETKRHMDVLAQIRLSNNELDQRLHNLEHEVGDLRGRVERLEARFLTS